MKNPGLIGDLSSVFTTGTSRQRLTALGLTVGLLLILLFTFLLNSHPDFSDYQVYYDAGIKALKGATVYDVDGHYQFKYAPVTALFFGVTLTLIPLTLSKVVFYIVMLAGWLLFLYQLIVASMPGRDARGRLSILGFIVLIFIIPLRDELKLGQINLIPFSLSFAAILQLQRNKKAGDIIAGLCISAAILFKLSYLILLPAVFLRFRWVCLFTIPVGLVLLNFIPLILYDGVAFAKMETLAWFKSLTQSSKDLLSVTANISVQGFFRHCGLSGGIANWLWLLWVLGLGFTFLIFRRKSWLFNFSLAMFALLLVNPLVWPYWSLLVLSGLLMILDKRGGIQALNPKSGNPVLSGIFLLFIVINLTQNKDFVQLYLQLPIHLMLFLVFISQAENFQPEESPLQ